MIKALHLLGPVFWSCWALPRLGAGFRVAELSGRIRVALAFERAGVVIEEGNHFGGAAAVVEVGDDAASILTALSTSQDKPMARVRHTTHAVAQRQIHRGGRAL
jgi:hypothetical protein